MFIETVAATSATPSSIGFQDVFGFGLVAMGFAFGIIFYLLVRKKVVNIF